MNKRPLFIIAIFFIIGIFASSLFFNSRLFIMLFIINCLLAASALFLDAHKRLLSVALLLSVMCLGSIVYINSKILSNGNISNLLGNDPLKTKIIGVIRSPALGRKSYFGKINSRYLFEIESMNYKGKWLAAEGLGYIKIQTESSYKYGDKVSLYGKIRKPISFKGFDYKKYLERKDIFFILDVKESNLTLLEADYKINQVLKYAYLFREKIKNNIISKMNFEQGAFLNGILFGDISELPIELEDSFKKSGTMHILAVSGLNVGLIAISILSFFKFLRLKREINYILVMIFLWLFTNMALFSPSVVRATIMMSIFLFGMLLGRRVDVYNSLGASALTILAINPKDLFDIGFQLSFLAVLSIVYFSQKAVSFSSKLNPYFNKYIYMPLVVSIAAWLATSPLAGYYFKIFCPISIVANIFIIPATFIILVGALVFMVIGWVPLVSELVALINGFFIDIVFVLARFFSSLKFGHFYFK